jgi:hypothetical protein
VTSASIYYRNRHRDPDFVLINGDSRPVDHQGDTDDGLGVLTAVDAACRHLGWKVATGARIVRQADGRGTVRIEPVGKDTPGAAGDGPADWRDHPTMVRISDQAATVLHRAADSFGVTPEWLINALILAGEEEGKPT